MSIAVWLASSAKCAEIPCNPTVAYFYAAGVYNMDTPKFVIGISARSAKIGLLATICAVAAFGMANTETGQRVVSQIGISDIAARTTDAAGRMVQNTSNAVQAFVNRSPGARGATDTLKGKAKTAFTQNSAAPDKGKPAQRALGKIFDEPLTSLTGPMAPAAPVVFLPPDADVAAAALPAMALAVPVGGGFFAPVTGGGFIIGGGGGGVGGGPAPIGEGPITPAPPTPPLITSAVPEPSTWMLLLIGFAAVGASIRRAKASQAPGRRRAGNCATAS